ncbi:MAG: P-II family nitrogen regulator [Erythrobacter sp.]
MTETTIRRRIEVLTDGPLVPGIERIAANAGIEHYTLIPTSGGMGHSGRWRDDQISGATAKVMFMAVTTQEGADRMIDQLTPLLETHHMVVLVSNVEVIRGERFA